MSCSDPATRICSGNAMHGLVSLLDEANTRRVEQLWRQLETKCGLAGVKVTPYPHFSWQIAVSYAEPHTEATLREIAAQMRTFKIHTDGLGIFSGPEPVVYAAIRRTAQMDRLHARLWRQIKSDAQGLSPLYNPRNWMPHITLIAGVENTQALLCGLELLALRPLDWEIEVNNLSFVSQFDGRVGTLGYRHDFGTG